MEQRVVERESSLTRNPMSPGKAGEVKSAAGVAHSFRVRVVAGLAQWLAFALRGVARDGRRKEGLSYKYGDGIANLQKAL